MSSRVTDSERVGDAFCIYSQYILPTLMAIAIVAIVVPTIIFIRAYRAKILKSSAFLFWFGLSYFTILSAYLFVNIMRYAFWCRYDDIRTIFNSIIPHFYPLQSFMIMGIFFTRLVYIFQGTTFKVSKLTNIGYSLLIIVPIMMAETGNWMNTPERTPNGNLLTGIGSAGYIITVFLLNGLFIYKMMRVYRMVLANNSVSKPGQHLVKLITKTSLLCFVSTIGSMVFLSSYQWRNTMNHPHLFALTVVILIVDMYTNYLSVLLSFAYFDDWYFRFCGCCHRKCHLFWNWRVNQEDFGIDRISNSISLSPTEVTPNQQIDDEITL